MDITSRKDALKVVRSVYATHSIGQRDLDLIISDYVRSWSSQVSDQECVDSVASALDMVFIQKQRFTAVRRVGFCLDAIGVPAGSSEEGKFVDKNPWKAQVTDLLFSFWSAAVTLDSLACFTSQFFAEGKAQHEANFRKYWYVEAVGELDPSEANKLAYFLFPDEALSPSGLAALRALVDMLSLRAVVPDRDDAVESELEVVDQPLRKLDDEQLSTHLGDFRELTISEKPKHRGDKSPSRTEKRDTAPRAINETESSADNSSEHEPADVLDGRAPSVGNGGKSCACLSAKVRQVIRQGGPRFAEFLSPLTMEVTTKVDLYHVLEYYRAGVQCVRTLCFHNNLPLSHIKCREL